MSFLDVILGFVMILGGAWFGAVCTMGVIKYNHAKKTTIYLTENDLKDFVAVWGMVKSRPEVVVLYQAPGARVEFHTGKGEFPFKPFTDEDKEKWL